MQADLQDGRIIGYIHDPLGSRIAKKVNNVIKEKYLWQGLTRLLAVYDGSGNLLIRFEYADSKMPIAMTKGSSTYYLSYDQVGSLRIVVDSGGNVLKRIGYDSFGNIISDSNPTFSLPFGFAGGLYDINTGFLMFGFRDYAASIGKWIEKDPLLFKGGYIDLYCYVGNDPINFADPKGLYVSGIGMGVTGAITGTVSPGVSGFGSIMYVWDDKGNKGIFVSASIGIAGGAGIVGGLQVSNL